MMDRDTFVKIVGIIRQALIAPQESISFQLWIDQLIASCWEDDDSVKEEISHLFSQIRVGHREARGAPPHRDRAGHSHQEHSSDTEPGPAQGPKYPGQEYPPKKGGKYE